MSVCAFVIPYARKIFCSNLTCSPFWHISWAEEGDRQQQQQMAKEKNRNRIIDFLSRSYCGTNVQKCTHTCAYFWVHLLVSLTTTTTATTWATLLPAPFLHSPSPVRIFSAFAFSVTLPRQRPLSSLPFSSLLSVCVRDHMVGIVARLLCWLCIPFWVTASFRWDLSPTFDTLSKFFSD